MYNRCVARTLALIFTIITAPLPGQWLHYPTAGIPRAADGKPDLSAPVPKTPDGKPDLSGMWRSNGLKYLLNLAADGTEPPFQPWAEALYNERKVNVGKDAPEARCLPQGVPMIDLPYIFKIAYTPGMYLILYEANNLFRQIFTDGRELPKEPNPTWLGYSVGHWDGDSFVIESRGFNDRMWIDTWGHPHTDALRVIERLHRRDFGNIDFQITIDDQKAYTKPWSVSLNLRLVADTELLEFVCIDRDTPHMVGK
jgi:hypothetical protein